MIDQHEKEYVVQFFMGSNDSFTHIRVQILLMDPMSSIDRVLSLTLKEEKQQKVLGAFVMTESVALRSTNIVSPGSNNKHHPKQRSKLVCTHCCLTGHTVETCYKLHGYPLGFLQNPRTITSSLN